MPIIETYIKANSYHVKTYKKGSSPFFYNFKVYFPLTLLPTYIHCLNRHAVCSIKDLLGQGGTYFEIEIGDDLFYNF